MRQAIQNSRGTVSMKVIKKEREKKSSSLFHLIHQANPFASNLENEVRVWRFKNLWHVLWGLRPIVLARLLKIPIHYGALYIDVLKADGRKIEYGLAGTKVVTDAGVNFIVDGFQNIVEVETMQYHGIGTGSTAEAAGDTALVTELTTQYSTDNTRATGTQTENGANVYRTVGTNTVDASVNLREHGIFTQAATGGGTLLDRTLFSSINLASSDSLQSTYDITFTSGG